MADAVPFDAFAADYDRQFSERLPARWLRAAVHARVAPLIQNGTGVVDLGCGTGYDAVAFARRGAQVFAIDASGAMLERAAANVAAGGLQDRVSLRHSDLLDWTTAVLPDGFEARIVFSNFGALNCVEDLPPLFELVRTALPVGGYAIVTMMGRFCLTESVYFALRGDWSRARRRWNGTSEYAAAGGIHPVWYHSPASVRRAASGFELVGIYGVGALLPPSEAYAVCERWPATFRRLAAIDRRLAPALYRLSDHYQMVLRRSA